jgi:hypothetical protein
MKLLIKNNEPFHNELIETIIHKYDYLLKINKSDEDQIFIHLKDYSDYTFYNYIIANYKNVSFTSNVNEEYDKIIHTTIYPQDLDLVRSLDKDSNCFICHKVTSYYEKFDNVFFLTPLAIPFSSQERCIKMDILPFQSQRRVNPNIPVFLIIGGLKKRNTELLTNILKDDQLPDFKIKILTRDEFPEILTPYKDKIIYKKDLNFLDFHRECLECCSILTLISRKFCSTYYYRRLTSSIAYAQAYNFTCILDNELQKIYQLDNCATYSKDILPAFRKVIDNFHKNESNQFDK